MKIAFFKNFTAKPFTFRWNGRPYTVQPGAKKSMPEYLARHAAKHLANHVLLTSGNPNDESYTSPKKPNEVPRFMEEFEKAFALDPDGIEMDDAGFVDEGKRYVDPQVDKMLGGENGKSTIIGPKVADVDDEDEEEFPGANQN